MGREGRALVALGVLFGLSLPLTLALHGNDAGSPTTRSRARAVLAAVAAQPDVLYSVPSSPRCLDAGIPIFPGAAPAPALAVDRSVARAITDLHLTPGLSGSAIFQAPFGTWTAGMQQGRDLLSLYADRMRPVNFWDMSVRLRNAIGVRPRGPVDSPPLLYVSPSGAVLLRPHPSGALDLILLCPAASS
ncbi:MAG: hypothetical protein M3Q23_05055 [Actinomycetota bacterium]|nr:hypothetical protein [Actinomycetota bacterium]